ncbi:hypothetical protein E3A20_04280, partial [Planctomyces bekefii]
MGSQVLSKKKQSRTIRSETRKIFFVVFAVLSFLGLFAVGATWKGKSVFVEIESEQLPLFRHASYLQQTTLDIVAIYYLLSGENDLELQMNQMWRYDTLESNFRKTLLAIETLSKDVDDEVATKKIAELASQIQVQFDELNSTAREMMLANMNGDRQAGKLSFKKLSAKIEDFRESVGNLEKCVSDTLKTGVGSALKFLTGSSLAGISLTFASIFIAMGLIRYLMAFLSISLLPISNLMHNLRQSVFSVDQSGKIISPVSKYSEKIFGDDIVGQSVDSLILDHLGKNSESYSLAQTAMTSVFGGDDMQWSLMEDNFPAIVRRSLGGQERALKLTYTPLYSEMQTVQNLMIVAEDVTELERAKAEASKKQAEVTILQGLIGVDRGDLLAYFLDASAGIQKCHELFTTMGNSIETRKLIFRTLHTIKGNSRLYNLMALSEVIHVAENSVVEINKRLDANESVGSEFYDAYLNALQDAESVLAQHTKVANTLFGTEDSMALSRFLLAEELMWFLELGSTDQSQQLFSASEMLSADLRIRHAFGLISPNFKGNLEKLLKISQHFGSQEVTESVQRLLNHNGNGGEDPMVAFRHLQDSFFRFTVQSPLNKANHLNFDAMVPIFNVLAALQTSNNADGVGGPSKENRTRLLGCFYDCWLHSGSLGIGKIRYLCRLGMLSVFLNQADKLRFVADELAKFLGWAISIECSVKLSIDSRKELAEAIASAYRGELLQDSEMLNSADVILCGVLGTKDLSGVPSLNLLADIAQNIGARSLTARGAVLVGTEDVAERFRGFLDIVKAGTATDAARVKAQSYIEKVPSEHESAVYNSCLKSICERLSFLRLFESYSPRSSQLPEAAVSKSMEVSSTWFEKISELSDKLVASPKNDLASLHAELQEHIASVFDYALANLCGKMSPMVRDLAIKLGKNIDYVVTGDPVALPRDQAYALRDALVHMLRNSIDHGIEMPDARAASGKPEFATIEINCVQTSKDSVQISVIDDGAGIAIDKVKKKAVEIGAISAETAATMTDEDAIQLIFISRLSTKEEVSTLSGRGVGMDAVKSIVVDRMRGKIEVNSRKSGGTCFKLTAHVAKRRGSDSNLDEMTSFLSGSAKNMLES